MNSSLPFGLTFSDIIEIIGILTSLSTSIVAIVVSLKTLSQNNRMLDGSSRPYVTIYLDAITLCEQSSYFVLKNFGNSPALITGFKYDPVLKNTPQDWDMLQAQFDFIEHIVLAPHQSKLLQYDVTKLPCEVLSFEITYSSSGKEYCESVTMNVKNFIHLPVSRPNSCIPKGNERHIHTLREMLERTM